MENPQPLNLGVQVAAMCSQDTDISQLLHAPPEGDTPSDFHLEQQKDPDLNLQQFLAFGALRSDEDVARKLADHAVDLALVDKILYYVNWKRDGCKLAVVPCHFRRVLLEDYHGGK